MTTSKSGPRTVPLSGIEGIDLDLDLKFPRLQEHRATHGEALGQDCSLCGYGICLRCGWCEHCRCSIEELENWIFARAEENRACRHPWRGSHQR